MPFSKVRAISSGSVGGVVVSTGASVGIDARRSRPQYGQVGCGGHCGHLPFKPRRQGNIVRIHAGNQRRPGAGNTEIQCIDEAAAGICQPLNAGILKRMPRTYLGASISGGIVDNEQFKILECLGPDAGQSHIQIGLAVMNRKNYAKRDQNHPFAEPDRHVALLSVDQTSSPATLIHAISSAGIRRIIQSKG